MMEFYRETEFKEDKKLGKIPKDWKTVQIADIIPDKRGAIKIGPFGSQLKKKELVSTGIKVYGQQNVMNNDFLIGDRYISDKKFQTLESVEIFPDDVLISMMGSVGHSTVFPRNAEKGIMDSHLIRIQVDGKKCMPEFLSKLINDSNLIKTQINNMSQGAIMSGLNSEIIRKIKLPLPPNSEQYKFVLIISKLDKAIQETDDIIQKTERLKKGLMQQLLIKGIGHDEFRYSKEMGCEIPIDWRIARLGDLALEIYRYPTYYNISYIDEGVPEVRGELINENGELEKDINEYRFISEKTSQMFPRTILKEGDFVLSVRGTMGKVAIVPKSFEGSNITANLMRIFLDRDKCYPPFFKQLFLSRIFKSAINKFSSQTTIKTIQAPLLKKIYFPLPPTIQEQERIASVLSNIDKKIKQERQTKEKFKKLKKGLMQILLAGQVRIKVN